MPGMGSIADLDNLSLIVSAAILADSVRHRQLAALAALHKSRSSHFPICSSLVSVASGRFILRADGHLVYTSLAIPTKSGLMLFPTGKSEGHGSHGHKQIVL